MLPDLLHPNDVADNLAGFLSGKAALVNAGGVVVYRGSLLAEIFQGNTEHLVVDLSPSSAGPSVRLQGVISLVAGGAEHGALHALRPLARAQLAVPNARVPSWQQIVSSMSIHKPAMIGTAGSGGQHSPSRPTTIAPMAPLAGTRSMASCDIWCRARRPVTFIPLGAGVVLACAGILVGLTRRVCGKRHEAVPE